MLVPFVVALASIFVVSLFLQACLLVVVCWMLRVRRETEPGRWRGVGLPRAFDLVLLIVLLDGAVLAATALVPAAWPSAPAELLLALSIALSLVLLLVVLRLGLPAGGLKTFGVAIVWRVLCVGMAVGLVFLLRALVGEALIIPTGGMAVTLLGYHKDVVCPQCGLRFPVNCSPEVDPGEGPPVFVSGCTCPNCRQKIRLERPGTPAPDEAAENVQSIPDPGWAGGDRIAAGKGFFGASRTPLERLDLLVFEYPRSRPGSAPPRYVDRLVGLPGETVAIHLGKLYVLGADERPPAAEEEARAEDEPPADPEGVELFRAGKFAIIRKNPEQILALRRLVHDNDHQAKDLADKPQFRRWAGEDNSGWAANGKTAFAHDGGKGKMAAWLRYRNVLRGDDKPQLITTFMGYNSFSGVNGHNAPAENWASDLIAECEVKIDKGQGAFLLELSRGPDRFQARFDLADGECTLSRLHDGKKPQVLEQAPSGLKETGAHPVRFANVDDRLVVWVDDRLVFGDGVAYDMPKQRLLAPTVGNDLKRPVSVGSEGAAVLVSKLKVFRDTYYTTQRFGTPNIADVEFLRADDPATFKGVENAPASCYRVGPGAYFVLGDNSGESADSRSWGSVPRAKLLGKVLFRYYPFSRAGLVR